MRGFEESLKQDMELERRVLKIIKKELRGLPNGWLKSGGGGKSVYENGRKSLPPEGDRAAAIATRRMLELKEKIIEENLKAQEILLGKYKSYRDDRVLERMRPIYRRILGDRWAKNVEKRRKARAAAQNASVADGTAFHGENLKHRNTRGEAARSKSELIIANIYEALRVPCSYEERVYWPEDAPVEAWTMKKRMGIADFYVSDFSVTFPDGRKKYHEHLGMMNDERYMETWKKKMVLYYWADIIPGQNLIITADNCRGGIDQQEIMRILMQEFGELMGTAKILDSKAFLSKKF